MRKYLAFFMVEWQQAINYRAEGLVWFILEFLPLVIMVNLSQYLLSAGRLDQAQYSQLVLYFILNLFVSRVSSIHFEDNLIDDIKDGRISSGLIKPYSFFWHLFPREATWRITGLIYLLPSILILLPLISTLQLPQFNALNLFIFILCLIIAFFQRFFFGWLISIPAFWLDQSKAFLHARWMAEGVFGGAWLPLFLFPVWWQNIAILTPFYYWFYFPVQVILGAITDMAFPLFISVVWLFILYGLSTLFWRKAVRFYSSVGG